MLQFFHSHKVSTAVTLLLLLAGGLASLWHLPFTLLPGIQHPVMEVMVTYGTSNPAESESFLTIDLDEKLRSLPSIDRTTVITGKKETTFTLYFFWGTDLDRAFLHIKDVLDPALAGQKNIHYSVRRSTRGQAPVLRFVVWQRQGIEYDVRFQDWARTEVLGRTSSAKGVQAVKTSGLNEIHAVLQANSMNLSLNGISRHQLVAGLSQNGNQNVTAPVFISDISGISRFTLLPTSRNLIFDAATSIPVPVDSLVTVNEKVEGLSKVWFNGRPAILFECFARPGSDVTGMTKRLDSLHSVLMKAEPAYGHTIIFSADKDILAARNNLVQSIVSGLVLSLLTLYLFLGSAKKSAAVFISVPASFSITFIAFYLLNIPLNLVSVASLILSSGVIVDNAIIILAFMDTDGDDIRPLVMPLSASIFTNIGVFAPFFFLEGFEKALFSDLMVGYSVSMLAALVVSLLFTAPVSLLLGKSRKQNPAIADRLYVAFHFLLKAALRKPGRLAFWSILILSGGMLGFWTLKFSMLPEDKTVEQSYTLSVTSADSYAGHQTRLEHLRDLLLETFQQHSGVQWLLNSESTTRNSLVLTLSSQKPTDSLQHVLLRQISGLGYSVNSREAPNALRDMLFYEGERLSWSYASADRTEPSELDTLLRFFRQKTGDESLELMHPPETILQAGARDSALRILGVRENELNNAWNTVFPEPFEWKINGRTRKARLTFGPEDVPFQERLLEVDSLNIPANRLFTFSEIRWHSAVERASGYPVVRAVSKQRKVPEPDLILLENGSQLRAEGRLVQENDLIGLIARLLGFSFLIILLVLLAQFEQLKPTILILSAIPVSWIGSLAALSLSGGIFTLYTLLGMVIVTGISVNDAILKTSHFIALRERYTPLRAMLLTSKDRFKPVVMTSLTTILAMMPVLFTSETTNPFFGTAIAVIGGLTFSTLQSLFLLPATFIFKFPRL